MILRWSLLATRRQQPPDVVIIGTDPILSVLIAIVWRFFQPDVVIAHWCFDLYPEAAFAGGLLSRTSAAARVMHYLLKKAYRACDLVVDIGPCMRDLLSRYDPALRMATLVPWALDEPPHVLPIPSAERRLLFGDAPIGLLYAGSFGRAHSYESLLKLARLLRPDGVRLTFSVRGNREKALRAAVQVDDSNVSFVPFAAAKNLADRLACADVHVVSLREEWTGAIVPSKSFGALAVGRPLLFCGDRGSAVAQWIERYDLGWVLADGNASIVASSISSLMKDPIAKEQMNQRCQRIYREHFSREVTLDEWQRRLTELISNRVSIRSRVKS
jgi:glycosyltransferase involved in cell wall biosynthesis